MNNTILNQNKFGIDILWSKDLFNLDKCIKIKSSTTLTENNNTYNNILSLYEKVKIVV